jgi:hypothetical protein
MTFIHFHSLGAFSIERGKGWSTSMILAYPANFIWSYMLSSFHTCSR